MKIAIQQEDTQLLADVLQKQLLAQVPSANVLQVKCAVQNEQLMTLIQHPQEVVFDAEQIFEVLTKALQRQSNQQSQKVQCFIRVSGEKLPYAKKVLSIEAQIEQDQQQQETASLEESNGLRFPPSNELPQLGSPVEEEVAPPSTFSSTVDDSVAQSPFGATDTDYSTESTISFPLESATDYSAESTFSSVIDDSTARSPFGSISIDDTSTLPFGAIDPLDESPFGHTTLDYDSDSPFDSATLDSLVDSQRTDSPFDSETLDSLVDSQRTDSPFDSETLDSVVDSSFDSTTQDSPNLSFGSTTTASGANFSFGSASIPSSTEDEVSFGSVPLESFSDAGAANFGSVPLESFPDTGTFLGKENEMEEEVFDPLAGAPNLLEQKPQRTLPPVPILVGLAMGVVLIFGGGGFFLVSSCVISECKELQTAEKFKTDSPTLIRQAKSAKDLEALQAELQAIITGLDGIPWWSPRRQQAQDLSTDFSAKLNSIDQVSKTLRQAEAALQQNKAPAKNIEELKARQTSWRKAIADLAAIKPNNEFYGLVKGNLPKYQLNLQALNEKILTEEKWFNKLSLSKKIAQSATQRQAQAKSGSDWQKVQTTWLVVVNALKSIPQDSSAYPEAQTLLAEYQPNLSLARDRATKEILAAQSYQKAINAANQAKAYGQRSQWQAAVTSWEQALQSARQVSNESFYYTQAQALVEPYSANLSQAQEQLQLAGGLAQTRTDLTKTCNNGLRFCTFTVDSQKILVRLTPDYERFLAGETSDLGDIQTHFQSLREALSVISQNANLPLVLYDTKGQEIAL